MLQQELSNDNFFAMAVVIPVRTNASFARSSQDYEAKELDQISLHLHSMSDSFDKICSLNLDQRKRFFHKSLFFNQRTETSARHYRPWPIFAWRLVPDWNKTMCGMPPAILKTTDGSEHGCTSPMKSFLKMKWTIVRIFDKKLKRW
ncbi:MAG: hypothetical protein ONB13_09480 [candidate division KSB1 bacterium]|nr:hypothetical protein [candidate division KSB1 bacterium]MDZ7376840.1 hypothetical protein [candidate division KSB1 bacterium]